MKAKIVLIVLIVALLCTSIASAGFFDWVTGKAISLKNLLQKSPANAISPVAVDKTVAANNAVPAANAATKVDKNKAELDKTPVQIAGLPDNAFWVHWENNINQFDSLINQIEKKEFTNRKVTA